LREPACCYICKQLFVELHFFYDQMCPACAAENWERRHQSVDLSGRVALLTGARVKIGYQAGIKLLRAGARLIATTRFPRDAARRYAEERDFEQWAHRLHIVGVDMRHTPSVERFAHALAASADGLDFLLNNACQTVRRPPAFYAHLLAAERQPLRGAAEALMGAGRHLTNELGAELSQVELLPEDVGGSDWFPSGQVDADRQQTDLRSCNSWRLTLAEVSTVEFLETYLVNAVAPFILNARLKPLMLRQRSFDKHIVNVSAVEGQFARTNKTDKHPHTNMAKAALNMMTRTSAADYARDGIFMNSVDTGWVTDEDPAEIAARKAAEHRFSPPLDIVDGAARICDPIFSGLRTGVHSWGQFFKDYRSTDW
jgi:NAD(P)-dependent dehydrogenase (short-subunit alcohol dehydrogenase family)